MKLEKRYAEVLGFKFVIVNDVTVLVFFGRLIYAKVGSRRNLFNLVTF